MLIFYSEAEGRQNVPAKSPVNESFENALNIFHSLSPRSGFIGIILKEPFVLQMMMRKKGVQIELLDTSIPAADLCEGADTILAEELIKAAGYGEDVFQIARQRVSVWEHLKMG